MFFPFKKCWNTDDICKIKILGIKKVKVASMYNKVTCNRSTSVNVGY